jgi:sec-independent protein translocase protein TatA
MGLLDNPIHLAFLLAILLMVFGAKRLPEMGRSLGAGLRGFRESISGQDQTVHDLAVESAPSQLAVLDTPPQVAAHNTPPVHSPPSAGPLASERDGARGRRAGRLTAARSNLHVTPPARMLRILRVARLRAIGHEERLTVVAHLDELRTRLFVAAAALACAFAVCFSASGRTSACSR